MLTTKIPYSLRDVNYKVFLEEKSRNSVKKGKECPKPLLTT